MDKYRSESDDIILIDSFGLKFINTNKLSITNVNICPIGLTYYPKYIQFRLMN